MSNLDTIISLATEQTKIELANEQAYHDALKIVGEQAAEIEQLKTQTGGTATTIRTGKIARRRPSWDPATHILSDVTGLYITEESAPGTSLGSTRYAKLAALFKYADEESGGAFNLYQTFIHPDEMTDGKIVAMAQMYNVELVADTVDLLCFDKRFYRNNVDGWKKYVTTARAKGIRIFAFDDTHTLFTRQGITMADLAKYVKAARDVYPECIITGTFGAGFIGATAYPVDVIRYQGYRQGETVNLINTWAGTHKENFILDLECFTDSGGKVTTPTDLKAMYKLMMMHPNITGSVAYAFFDGHTDLRLNQSLFEALVVRSAIYWRNR